MPLGADTNSRKNASKFLLFYDNVLEVILSPFSKHKKQQQFQKYTHAYSKCFARRCHHDLIYKNISLIYSSVSIYIHLLFYFD